MIFALAKELNACRSIMIKSCIVLVSFHHEVMLTFNLPVILAKQSQSLWPLHQQFVSSQSRDLKLLAPLPGIYIMCEQKHTLPVEYGVIFARTQQLLL